MAQDQPFIPTMGTAFFLRSRHDLGSQLDHGLPVGWILMHLVPECFEPRCEADVIDLVERHPMAWVVSANLTAILLPVRPVIDRGRLVSFQGHMPRRLADSFIGEPSVLLLFTGLNAYISPSWFRNRSMAPTWSSESATFRCTMRLIEDPAILHEVLADLVGAMEGGRLSAWDLCELGPRYSGLANRLVPFRAEIFDRRTAFRLGQDEDDLTFEDIQAGLKSEGKATIAKLMLEHRRAIGDRN